MRWFYEDIVSPQNQQDYCQDFNNFVGFSAETMSSLNHFGFYRPLMVANKERRLTGHVITNFQLFLAVVLFLSKAALAGHKIGQNE